MVAAEMPVRAASCAAERAVSAVASAAAIADSDSEAAAMKEEGAAKIEETTASQLAALAEADAHECHVSPVVKSDGGTIGEGSRELAAVSRACRSLVCRNAEGQRAGRERAVSRACWWTTGETL